MFTLIFVLAIVILIILDHFRCENEAIISVLVFSAIISGFITMISFGFVVSTYNVEEKIVMYEEENATIEQNISTVVQAYMNHESAIFDKITQNNDNTMMLVSMYPELQSNTVVQEQIGIYVENNIRIKELKEEAISASIWRWFFYFGK